MADTGHVNGHEAQQAEPNPAAAALADLYRLALAGKLQGLVVIAIDEDGGLIHNQFTSPHPQVLSALNVALDVQKGYLIGGVLRYQQQANAINTADEERRDGARPD